MSKAFYATALGQMHLMNESMGMPTHMIGRTVNTSAAGDYGSDPVGDGTFRMVPSGDIVDFAEMMRRLPARR